MILSLNGNSNHVRRKEREREFRREAILEAALRVFAREGYFNATMAHIAAEAEFGMGTIYQVFPNKQGLFAEVILRGIEEFMKEQRELLATKNTWQEKLHSFIEYKLSWVEKHPEIQRLLMELFCTPIPEITPQIITRALETHIANIETLKKILSQANTDGQRFDMDLTAITIMGTLNAIGNDWFIGILPKAPTEYIPGIIESITGEKYA
jgi:TetR/AcrR family fatty acid metabolism transcriptional regulator